MKKFEYRFIYVPTIKFRHMSNQDKKNKALLEFESSCNELGKDGFELVEVNWMVGIAYFKKEII